MNYKNKFCRKIDSKIILYTILQNMLFWAKWSGQGWNSILAKTILEVSKHGHFMIYHIHSSLAFYVKLHRAVIGPSATLTGRWRPDIDLRRMLTGLYVKQFINFLTNMLL